MTESSVGQDLREMEISVVDPATKVAGAAPPSERDSVAWILVVGVLLATASLAAAAHGRARRVHA